MIRSVDFDVTDFGLSGVDASMKQIHVAEKVINEGVGGMMINFLRRPYLLDPPVIHQHHAIGDFDKDGFVEYSRHSPKGLVNQAWKDSWAITATDQNWRTLDAVETIARRHDTTPAAVALAWLLGRPEVSSVIVGARTVQQLQENLRALSVTLLAEDQKQLEEVSRPAWGYPYSFIGSREPW